jgi:hypothetical protein
MNRRVVISDDDFPTDTNFEGAEPYEEEDGEAVDESDRENERVVFDDEDLDASQFVPIEPFAEPERVLAKDRVDRKHGKPTVIASDDPAVRIRVVESLTTDSGEVVPNEYVVQPRHKLLPQSWIQKLKLGDYSRTSIDRAFGTDSLTFKQFADEYMKASHKRMRKKGLAYESNVVVPPNQIEYWAFVYDEKEAVVAAKKKPEVVVVEDDEDEESAPVAADVKEGPNQLINYLTFYKGADDEQSWEEGAQYTNKLRKPEAIARSVLDRAAGAKFVAIARFSIDLSKVSAAERKEVLSDGLWSRDRDLPYDTHWIISLYRVGPGTSLKAYKQPIEYTADRDALVEGLNDLDVARAFRDQGVFARTESKISIHESKIPIPENGLTITAWEKLIYGAPYIIEFGNAVDKRRNEKNEKVSLNVYVNMMERAKKKKRGLKPLIEIKDGEEDFIYIKGKKPATSDKKKAKAKEEKEEVKLPAGAKRIPDELTVDEWQKLLYGQIVIEEYGNSKDRKRAKDKEKISIHVFAGVDERATKRKDVDIIMYVDEQNPEYLIPG